MSRRIHGGGVVSSHGVLYCPLTLFMHDSVNKRLASIWPTLLDISCVFFVLVDLRLKKQPSKSIGHRSAGMATRLRNWMRLYTSRTVHRPQECTCDEIEAIAIQRIRTLDYISSLHSPSKPFTLSDIIQHVTQFLRKHKWELFVCDFCDTTSFYVCCIFFLSPSNQGSWSGQWWKRTEQILFLARASAVPPAATCLMALQLQNGDRPVDLVEYTSTPGITTTPRQTVQQMMLTSTNCTRRHGLLLLDWRTLPAECIAKREVQVVQGKVLVEQPRLTMVLNKFWSIRMSELSLRKMSTDPDSITANMYTLVSRVAKWTNMPFTQLMVQTGYTICSVNTIKQYDVFCRPQTRLRCLAHSSDYRGTVSFGSLGGMSPESALDAVLRAGPVPACVAKHIELCKRGSNALKHHGRRSFVLWCKAVGISKDVCVQLLMHASRCLGSHAMAQKTQTNVRDVKRWYLKDSEISCKGMFQMQNSHEQGVCPYKTGKNSLTECKQTCVQNTFDLPDIEAVGMPTQRLPSYPSDFLLLQRTYFIEPNSSDEETV